MRVIQRLMGVDNPITDLKVYEHTLHFRNGIATIEQLTEREINRLRAFGFRVERDDKKAKTVPKAMAAETPETGVSPLADPGSLDTQEMKAVETVQSATPQETTESAPPPKSTPKAARLAKAKKED